MTISELSIEFEHNYMQPRLRPTTIRGYETNIRLHLLPKIGETNLEDLTVTNLDQITEELKSKLSNRSIVYIHATLRKMLNGY